VSYELQEKIREAIDTSLPTEVGTALKQRLEQADRDAEAVVEMTEGIRKKNDIMQSQEHMIAELKANEKIAAELDAREREITLREKLIELKEQHANARVADMRSLVEAVFANNRFKYSMTGQVPVADGNGCVYSQPTTRDVEGEG